MNIVIEYDSSANNAPAGFKEAVQAAVQFYDYLITDNITVPIVFSYGEIDGQSISRDAVAESSTNGNVETYASVVSLLTSQATTTTAKAAIASLPATDPTNGGSFWVSDAQAQVFGLGSEPGYTDPEDGFVGVSSALNFTWSPTARAVPGDYDAIGAIEHEISEVIGRYDYLGGGPSFNGVELYSPLDLFRYSAPGVRTVAFSSGYFSVTGQTLELPFNDPNNGGDGGDWDASVVGDSYGDASQGIEGLISPTDLQVMNVLGYQLAPLATPVAGAAPVVTSVDGAQTSISYATLFGLITGDYTGAMSVQSASLVSASSSAGTITLNSTSNTLQFTPAAGFSGTATIDVTLNDNYGATVVQPVTVDVVVAASAPTVTLPNTTSTSVNGNVTTITTYSPSGALISTEVITVNGNETVTTSSNASGVRYAADILQNQGGGVTQNQVFDGSWNQQSATITTVNGNTTEVQSFNGSWVQTGATFTTVNGNVTIVQTFDANWNQLSATRTDVETGYTEVQNFNASWVQTSASLTFNLPSGAVETQYFDAHWNQTSATLVTHPTAAETETQTFNASWVQTGAAIVTVTGGQTTTQTFDANWNQLGVTIDTPLSSGPITDRLQTFSGNWALLSEVDTQTNTGQDYIAYGQTGGGTTFTASASHSTTYVFDPGQLKNVVLSGLHTLSLNNAIHDVIDFEGYGAGAHLVQVNSTTWQIVSTNNPTETFQVTGGGTLADGDYQFIAAGTAYSTLAADIGARTTVATSSNSILSSQTSATTADAATSNASTSGQTGSATSAASVTVFNQFAAAGLSSKIDAGEAIGLSGPAFSQSAMLAKPALA